MCRETSSFRFCENRFLFGALTTNLVCDCLDSYEDKSANTWNTFSPPELRFTYWSIHSLLLSFPLSSCIWAFFAFVYPHHASAYTQLTYSFLWLIPIKYPRLDVPHPLCKSSNLMQKSDPDLVRNPSMYASTSHVFETWRPTQLILLTTPDSA